MIRPHPDWLTVREAARALGITVDRMRSAMAQYPEFEGRTCGCGGRVWVDPEAVRAYAMRTDWWHALRRGGRDREALERVLSAVEGGAAPQGGEDAKREDLGPYNAQNGQAERPEQLRNLF